MTPTQGWTTVDDVHPTTQTNPQVNIQGLCSTTPNFPIAGESPDTTHRGHVHCPPLRAGPTEGSHGDTPATAALTAALAALGALGRSTPCQERGGDLWFGSPSERLAAVQLCGPCPVVTLCRAFGDEVAEQWGVPGGVDREADPSWPR
jgi:hypothetical protein